MPWTPTYSREQLALAVEGAEDWREVLAVLGLRYHGKTIARTRAWAARWDIATGHLSDNRGRRRSAAPYSDDELRAAVWASLSWAETLRKLGLCPTGGNPPILRRRCAELGISTDHFDPYAHNRTRGAARRMPLDEILVENSTYSRDKLKARLYRDGIKEPSCEMCGQTEEWNGMRIGMIIDHINGVRNDNRLENLRIVCPNCAAGLDTHCGRKNKRPPSHRPCEACGSEYLVNDPGRRFCSVRCAAQGRADRQRGLAQLHRRKVERPSLPQLQDDLAQMSFLAVGRKYGVSDNAIRKWLVFYEREAERERREAA